MSQLTEEISRSGVLHHFSPHSSKTTLTEKFLLYGGAIAQAGVVKGKENSRRHLPTGWRSKAARI